MAVPGVSAQRQVANLQVNLALALKSSAESQLFCLHHEKTSRRSLQDTKSLALPVAQLRIPASCSGRCLECRRVGHRPREYGTDDWVAECSEENSETYFAKYYVASGKPLGGLKWTRNRPR